MNRERGGWVVVPCLASWMIGFGGFGFMLKVVAECSRYSAIEA